MLYDYFSLPIPIFVLLGVGAIGLITFFYIKFSKKLWWQLNAFLIFVILSTVFITFKRILEQYVLPTEIFSLLDVIFTIDIVILFVFFWYVMFDSYKKKRFPTELEELVRALIILMPILIIVMLLLD